MSPGAPGASVFFFDLKGGTMISQTLHFASAAVTLALLASVAGCGSEFTSCAEAASCGDGGSGGSGGAGGAGSGTGQGGATSTATGPTEACSGPEDCLSTPGAICEEGTCACPGAGPVDVSSSIDHCGACGAACPPVAGGSVACVSGACVVATCPAKSADCDGDVSNGCETDTSTDAANCGGCGTVCATQCKSSVCADPVQITAGARHTCVVRGDGTVWCWGSNNWGQLGTGAGGTGDAASSPTPMKVGGLAGHATQVAASADPVREHTCARLATGALACWGANSNGQLGLGFVSLSATTAAPVASLSDVTGVALGGRHTCAVTKSKQLYCWGDAASSQLGLGDTVTQHDSPQLVALGGVEEVSLGREHTCARTGGSEIFCWGLNTSGQTGQIINPAAANPAKVSGLAPADRIYTGDDHSCALLQSGQLSCWGRNHRGQLGNGMDTTTHVPAAVSSPSGVTDAGLGRFHTTAVAAKKLHGWGDNPSSQVGAGLGNPILTPVELSLPNVVQSAAGESHTCALTAAGEVYCWGLNDQGQIGTGTIGAWNAPVLTPTKVVFPAN